jgi:DNA polymerase-1
MDDVISTGELYEKLVEPFEPYKPIWENFDRAFMLLLLKMETKGIPVDLEMCRELEARSLKRLAEIRVELGFDPSKPSQLHPRLFDEPPWGLGLKPLTLTPGGKAQVNTRFLERTNHPICGLLLEYRGLQKQVTSYFSSYQRIAGKSDRVHPTFKMHGTVTGRLSCENPNLQQVPRDSKVKDVFMPEEGCDLVEIDYSNIEMRLAAIYSAQPELLEEFSKREGDVHGRVAQALNITRQKAKTVNFLTIYGGGKRVLADQLRIKESEAAKILADYRKSYPEIFTTMNAAASAADNNRGEIRLWSDRVRHFPFQSEHHKAFNSIIQGGAFEIVKRSMLLLDDAGFDIRNQVHDSVWLNVEDRSTIKRAEEIMEGWVEETFGLPFYVESKTLRSRK